MPIYEYRCGACGHEFEEWQKVSDAPVRKCPQCHKNKVERLISLSSFQLKGSGWYITDYGRGGHGGGGKKRPPDGDKSSAKKPSGDGGGDSSSDGEKPKASGKAPEKASGKPSASTKDSHGASAQAA